jgi:hypothetical protein
MLSEIFEDKNISDSSKKLYISNLTRLNDGIPPTSLDFLLDPGVVLDKIKKYKPTTQRNYIIAITSILKSKRQNSDDFDEIYKMYYNLLNDFNLSLKDSTSLTETEKDSWITQESLENILKNKMDILMSLKGKSKLSISDYNNLLELVVLGLYTLTKPRRNKDYQLMKIKNEETDDKSFNYLDLVNKKFIFNNYKTNKTYDTQIEDIPKKLLSILKTYIKFKPESDFLLVNFNGEPLTNINSITRILNKIFDKNISSTMLRKMYLTNKYSDTMSELKSDAKAMGTSTNVAQTNYIKKK